MMRDDTNVCPKCGERTWVHPRDRVEKADIDKLVNQLAFLQTAMTEIAMCSFDDVSRSPSCKGKYFEAWRQGRQSLRKQAEKAMDQFAEMTRACVAGS